MKFMGIQILRTALLQNRLLVTTKHTKRTYVGRFEVVTKNKMNDRNKGNDLITCINRV